MRPGGSITTILVIDDDPAARARVRDAAPADWLVLEAPDGLSGLDLARREGEHLRLVVLDIELPDMEGRLICLRLRDLSPALPILPFTGHADTAPVLAELACRTPVFKTAGDEELAEALIAAVREPPVPFAPGTTVSWMQAAGQSLEELIRAQRARVRVVVYAASPYHRGALARLLPTGVHVLDAAQLPAIERMLRSIDVLALVAHADDYAGVAPLAAEQRVPLVLVAADEAQALAARAAHVAAVLLEADEQIERRLAHALEQLAEGLTPEQPALVAGGRQAVRHVAPAHVVRRLAGTGLSARELDVLWLFAQGMTAEQAARLLRVERSTVQSHWKSAARKLGVRRAEVPAWLERRLADEG